MKNIKETVLTAILFLACAGIIALADPLPNWTQVTLNTGEI
jgi:hypothetical protein